MTLQHCTNEKCLRELRPREKLIHKWCPTCYKRWNNSGRPAEGVPDAGAGGAAARAAATAATRDRQEEAVRLSGRGHPPQYIAARLGVAQETVRRYLRENRRNNPMSSLNGGTDGLNMGPSKPRVPEAAPDPDLDVINGRPVIAEERDTLNEAYRAMRLRDCGMLAGLPLVGCDPDDLAA